MKWADYCISKLSLTKGGWIDTICFHKDLGDKINVEEIERARQWMVEQVNAGKTFCFIKKTEDGSWFRIGDLSYDGNVFTYYTVAKNITCRKTFVSYYHKDDQPYREKFANLFDDLIVCKSVDDDDIDSDNSDEYIKQLIQKDYLSDTTVLIVLIGPNTKCRKHVDWEIAGALNKKVGDNYAGLIGIFLPTHPDFGSDKYNAANIPGRLAANVKSGYAILRDWTDDRVKMQEYIEKAFENRSKSDKIENKSIPQMKENTCE